MDTLFELYPRPRLQQFCRMKQITITTDGACNPNPGRGGWAAVLRYRGAARAVSGHAPDTTNNLMELAAIVEALRCLKEPCDVTIRTDSRTAIGWCGPTSFTKLRQRRLYPRALALAEEYRRIASAHTVTFLWIKGHAGDADNELADYLAESECRRPF